MLLVHKQKIIKELLKSISQKFLFKQCASINRNTPTQAFLIAVLRNFQIVTKTIVENNIFNQIDAWQMTVRKGSETVTHGETMRVERSEICLCDYPTFFFVNEFF